MYFAQPCLLRPFLPEKIPSSKPLPRPVTLPGLLLPPKYAPRPLDHADQVRTEKAWESGSLLATLIRRAQILQTSHAFHNGAESSGHLFRTSDGTIKLLQLHGGH